MPVVSVDKYALFKELGETFTPDSFQKVQLLPCTSSP